MHVAKLCGLGTVFALIFFATAARATESVQDYKFQIVDGTTVTTVSIGVPKDLDTNFPAPRSVDAVNVNEVDTQKITNDGVELLDRWSGIFLGPIFHRLSGSVGLIIRIFKDPVHKSLADLHAELGRKLEIDSKSFLRSDVMASGIVLVGKREYSYHKVGGGRIIGVL